MNWKDIAGILGRDVSLMSRAEEEIYEGVALEIASKHMRPGVFAKAFSEAEGDESKAIAIYIEYRVAQIRQELLDEEVRLSREAEKVKRAALNDAKSRWEKLDAEDKKLMEHEKRLGRKNPTA